MGGARPYITNDIFIPAGRTIQACNHLHQWLVVLYNNLHVLRLAETKFLRFERVRTIWGDPLYAILFCSYLTDHPQLLLK